MPSDSKVGGILPKEKSSRVHKTFSLSPLFPPKWHSRHKLFRIIYLVKNKFLEKFFVGNVLCCYSGIIRKSLLVVFPNRFLGKQHNRYRELEINIEEFISNVPDTNVASVYFSSNIFQFDRK